MVDPSLSDNIIAKRVRDGDKDAFGCLVDKYSDLVFGIALKHTRNRREAVDLTQEVFVKAYESLGEVNDYSIFDHWLSKIAANAGLNWVRDRDNERVAAFSEVEGDRPEELPARERGEDLPGGGDGSVIRVLAQLPEKMRIIVLKKYMDGYSYSRIAEDLGISVATVRMRIARAKQMMKALLVDDTSRQSAQT